MYYGQKKVKTLMIVLLFLRKFSSATLNINHPRFYVGFSLTNRLNGDVSGDVGFLVWAASQQGIIGKKVFLPLCLDFFP